MKKIIKTVGSIILSFIIFWLIFYMPHAKARKNSDVTQPQQIQTPQQTQGRTKRLIQVQLSSLFKPVKKGEKVTITVTFDTAKVKGVNIPNVGTATKEQLKEGKCSFTVQLEKTTKYILQYKAKYTNLPLRDDSIPFEIVVVDENGNKIE